MSRGLLKNSIGILLYFAGAAVLYLVVSPVIIYELSNQRFDGYISPVPANAEESIDLTKASNWFPAAQRDFAESQVSHYTISIPKLRIKDATVAIGGEDLADSLIQYPGTASPGKIGNSVIFGHSILPQFYDPEDYMAIFSLLPSLKKGDEIKVRYDGIGYTYKVEDMFEVRPEDIQVLDQNDNDSYLSLITCTPPGHPLKPKRLIVRAKLVPPQTTANNSL
jgi:sortase A